MDALLEACTPTDWWGLLSLFCGIFVIGTAVGGLIGAALMHEALAGVRHPEDDLYDPRRPQ